MYNVAIVGATGAVGEELLRVLEEYDIPVKKLVPLASARSVGKEVEFKGETYKVKELTCDVLKMKRLILHFLVQVGV